MTQKRERGLDSPDPTPKEVIAVDIEDPNRPNLLNDEVVQRIAEVLGGSVKKYSKEPVWHVQVGTEIKEIEIKMQSNVQKKHRDFTTPAYDKLFIYGVDRPRGGGHLDSADEIVGISSVEITEDSVTFVQDVEAWEFRYTIGSGPRFEINFKSKEPPLARTVGYFSFQLKGSGLTLSQPGYF